MLPARAWPRVSWTARTSRPLDFSLMHLKSRSVVWQRRQRRRRSTFRTEPTSGSWRGNMSVGNQDEDFAWLVTQAQVMYDANQLFISHADQPADTPAAGCDTVGMKWKWQQFDLDEEEEPEEEDKCAAAASSSSVAGAAIKHKRTMDKFFAWRIVYGKGPKSLTPLVGCR